MAYHDKIQLTFTYIVPPDQVAEGDRLFQSHGSWMASTHHRTGEKALLSYNLAKGPELSNPMDPTLLRPATHVSSRARSMKAKLVFSITLSRPIIGKTSPLRASGSRNAKPRLLPQLPSLTRSGEESGFN